MIQIAELIIVLALISKLMSQEIENLPSCFKGPVHHSTTRLEEVELSERKPTEDKTIFFHVTNCWSNGYINLNSRESCAIESAALNNPSFDIFVLFAGPTYLPKNSTASPIVSSLMSHKNVFLRNINIFDFEKGTVGEFEDEFGVENLFGTLNFDSDLLEYLRLLTLYRWGGICMDLGVIVTQSFENQSLNFVGAETDHSINYAVTSFVSQSLYTEDILVRFRSGRRGASNLEKYIMETLCKGAQSITDLTEHKCEDFQVFPPEKFYPLSFSRLNYLFEEKYLEKALQITKKSFVVHTWEKVTRNFKHKVGTQALYGVLADLYCPKVYYLSGEYF